MQRLRIFSLLLLILVLAACTQKQSSQAASTDSTSPHAVAAPAPVPAPAPAPTALPATSPDESARNQPAPAPASDVRHRPDESAVQTKTFEIPSGTRISVRNDQLIDSSQAVVGQTHAAQVTTDVRSRNGKVVIPRGARAQLVIKSASKGGRIQGAADLVLALKSVSIGGRQYLVKTTDISEQGKKGIGKNKRTGKFLGGGAAAGGIIGAIAGGGKGAIIGGVTGAGAGGTAQVLTKEKSIKIPAETPMTFRLEAPVRIVKRG